MLLKNGKKIIVGYDLANDCSQISYCYKKEESDIETVGVDGEENYDIPTVLCKRNGTNQWLFGHAALRFGKEHPDEGILIENLLQMALDGEVVQIDGKGYHPAALLALFIKRSLGTVLAGGSMEKISALVFTCQETGPRVEALLQRIIKTLEIKGTEVFSQCYEESFFYFLTHQPKELWQSGALLLDYRGEDLVAVCVDGNINTVPKVMYSIKRRFRFAGTDKELLDIGRELCEGKFISSIYLIGKKFGGDWMADSLRYLCLGRRVFQGNNLYSKGACYSVPGGSEEDPALKEYLFLGPDKLKANIGMKVRKRGEDAYNALLDAGMEWSGIEEIFEFYLKGENNIELLVTPLIKAGAKHIFMELDQMRLSEEEFTRVRMKLTMPDENMLRIEVEDLGFGEFKEASDKKWIKEVEL